MSAKTGQMMKLYKNTATHATPTWVEIADVGDVSIPDFEMGLAELKRRSNSFTKNLATLIQSISVEFRLISGLGATIYTAARTDFLAGTPREYAVFDGAIATTGNQGLRLPALIAAFPWDQPLEDVAGHDVRLAVAYMEEAGADFDPSWLLVP